MGWTWDQYRDPGNPLSRAKDQQSLACQVWQAIWQPNPVKQIKNSKKIAAGLEPVACLYSSRMGTRVAVLTSSSRFVMEKNIAMEYTNAVTNPIATVPIIAKGILRSGCGTSSAKCVAESRHANDQLGLIRPTMKAIAFDSQPVLLTKLANTNFAFCFGDEVAKTVIVITMNEVSET